MKTLIASAFLLFSPVLVLAQTPAPAKKALPASKATAAKPAAGAAKAAPKPRKPAKSTGSRVEIKGKANSLAAAVVAVEAALSPEELTIAEKVHTGKMPCELGADVTVTRDTRLPGYFDVEGKGFKYRMVPVATKTGAVRLEDNNSGAVWLQVATKSMLMNQKLGQRQADECQAPEQIAFATEYKKNPTGAGALDEPVAQRPATAAAKP